MYWVCTLTFQDCLLPFSDFICSCPGLPLQNLGLGCFLSLHTLSLFTSFFRSICKCYLLSVFSFDYPLYSIIFLETCYSSPLPTLPPSKNMEVTWYFSYLYLHVFLTWWPSLACTFEGQSVYVFSILTTSPGFTLCLWCGRYSVYLFVNWIKKHEALNCTGGNHDTILSLIKVLL